MCGIVGILTTDKEKQGKLTGALSSIKHRGPDDSGEYFGDYCALGHVRLSVIDLSEMAHQPMIDHTNGLVIVFNGEIYNYKELRKELSNEYFSSNSDTEVILKYFLRYGENCVDYLRGMFAFAIWDVHKKRLFIARDRFGIKPLFYYTGSGTFIFASEIKAILQFGVPSEPDLVTCYEYVAAGKNCYDEKTFFKDIAAINPGYCGYVTPDNVELKQYWELEFDEVQEGISQERIEEELWQLNQEVGRLHMISDIPVGISLSSGIDSVFLLYLLAKLGCENINTFTFGYEEGIYDEIRRQARLEIKVPHVSHHCRLRPENFFDILARQIWHYEYPLGGLGCLSSFQMMGLAKENKISVLLGGEGADEAFAGYKYYYFYYFQDLLRQRKSHLLETTLARFNGAHGTNYAVDDRDFLDLLPGESVGKSNVMAPDGTSLNEFDFSGRIFNNISKEKEDVVYDSLRARMKADLTELKIPKLLMFQDRASMAWGVETRVPFLDHKLIEYAYSLSSQALFLSGKTKDLVRRSLKRDCDFEYRTPAKLYVATPQREWLKNELFDEVLDFVDNGIIRGTGMIDYPKWRRKYEQYSKKTQLGNSFFVWKVVCLEALFRKFFPNYQ
jgi:asparagine synthase (glutamine-hydrolysing)